MLGALALMTSCAAPMIKSDSVRSMVELMDKRVDAYALADPALTDESRAATMALGDATLALLDSGDEVEAKVLELHVQPLYKSETAYTLADSTLTPRMRESFLRSGLLILTICARAQGATDPSPPFIPGLDMAR